MTFVYLILYGNLNYGIILMINVIYEKCYIKK